jgi:hypothetical protein
MKTKLLLVFVALTGATLLHAGKITAGPNGGRLLDARPLKAEFFVTPDRKVEVTLYDDHANPVLPEAQTVTVIAEPAGGRVTLNLDKTATAFVSSTALPAGEPYRLVVQIRATPEAKPQNFRVDLNLSTCGECKHAEYACTCEGH